MKMSLLTCLAVLLFQISFAQLGDVIKRKAGEGVRQGTAAGTERTIDKGIDKIFSKKDKKAQFLCCCILRQNNL